MKTMLSSLAAIAQNTQSDNIRISKSIEAAKSSENGTPLCLTGHKLGQEYDELAQEVLSRC